MRDFFGIWGAGALDNDQTSCSKQICFQWLEGVNAYCALVEASMGCVGLFSVGKRGLICAIVFMFIVINNTELPNFAAAFAASQPAWPAPTTITSYSFNITHVSRGTISKFNFETQNYNRKYYYECFT